MSVIKKELSLLTINGVRLKPMSLQTGINQYKCGGIAVLENKEGDYRLVKSKRSLTRELSKIKDNGGVIPKTDFEVKTVWVNIVINDSDLARKLERLDYVSDLFNGIEKSGYSLFRVSYNDPVTGTYFGYYQRHSQDLDSFKKEYLSKAYTSLAKFRLNTEERFINRDFLWMRRIAATAYDESFYEFKQFSTDAHRAEVDELYEEMVGSCDRSVLMNID